MDRGHVGFHFAGLERRVPVTIGLGILIEERTGKGLLSLMREFHGGAATLRDAATIVRLGLRAAGDDELNDAEFLEGVDDMGIVPTMAVATEVIASLFKTPKKKSTAAKKKTAAPETIS